jgi:poly-gamma-glutamate synthesis protein (capsule biosynthesis protein)
VTRRLRPHIRLLATLACSAVLLAACTGTTTEHASTSASLRSAVSRTPVEAVTSGPPSPSPSPSSTEPPGQFTFAFAGDVHFMDRTATRLADDPATVFGVAQPVLDDADLTMVNLETAITTAGVPQDKEFTFRAPASAFTALRDGGVDVATMANNHGADYGLAGLHDTLAAIASSHFPVVGIGADAAQAYAPWTTTVSGVRIAVLAASQVQDETLANWSAGAESPGIANAFSPRFLTAVRAARAAGYVVITYVHWGTEFLNCPNADQQTLAGQLAAAGASAVIGTHAHVLQGAGWRADGVYVEYGLGNYLWWMSFGNDQDDNGVLKLTFDNGKVIANSFFPSHLDDTGVPVPATGAQAARITAQWNGDRQCTNLSAHPPS